MQGPELQVGFAVNGVPLTEAPLRSRGGRPGDRLLLSRPLGSGALFAAHMQARADGRDVEHALALMEEGNAEAGALALAHGARALTDVTGFALAGHLLAMLDDGLAARVEVDAIPLLPGFLRAVEAGIYSTAHESNERAFAPSVTSGPSAAGDARVPAGRNVDVLYDPQTGGGLLMALPADRAGAALAALAAGGAGAAIIGTLCEATPSSEPILLT